MSVLHWFVFFSTIGTVVLLWAFYILQNFSKKVEKTPLDEEEERLVELMGRVRIFVDSKLEQLDKKMEEVRDLIRDLNEQYVSLVSLELEKGEKGEKLKNAGEFTEKMLNFDLPGNNKSLNYGMGYNSLTQNSQKQFPKDVDNKTQITRNFFSTNNQYGNAQVQPNESYSQSSYYESEHDISIKSVKSDIVNNGEKDSIEKKIFEMFQNGMEAVEIAKTLKMGVGEVQLIIDLMKRQDEQR